jgi:phospholipase/lecithinase/hemolysin
VLRNLVLILIFLAMPWVAEAMISNVVVFGDSLSDIGNFPESETSFYPGTNKISQCVYLPARNPINLTETDHYTVPGSPKIVLSYPNVNAVSYLPKQARIDGAVRGGRAMNWTQYFLHEAKLKHVIERDDIAPWITVYNKRKSPAASVNYAYYGALTTNDCHDQDYGHQSDCDLISIYKTQQTYRDGPQDVIGMNTVQVPGLQKQVTLFKNDLEQKKITVDTNTAVLVMIGGNDIAVASEKIQSLQPANMRDAMTALTGGIADNVAVALEQIIQTPNIRHIYLMNIYNLGLSPKVYNNLMISRLASELTKVYNHQLLKRIDTLRKQHPSISFNLYDTHAQFEAQAYSDVFKVNLGRQCDENSEYLTADSSPINCGSDQGHDAYLFWNDVHPSSLADQFLAHGLLEFVRSTWVASSVLHTQRLNSCAPTQGLTTLSG